MRILLTILIFLSGLITSAQSTSGCANIDLGDDVIIDCSESCVTLEADVVEVGQTTQYNVTSIPHDPPYPYDPEGQGTIIFVGEDDRFSDVVPLPFDFCFFENNYNEIVVGANGVLSFNTELAGEWCEWNFNQSIPNTTGEPYRNSINGAYHDMNPEDGGEIRYAVLGEYPCRTFIVNYFNVPHWWCDNIYTTQQIVLYETTNIIDVYISDKPTCNIWNNGNAMIGIQNAQGTIGHTPLDRNTGPWSTEEEAWRFSPNGASVYNINWYDEAGNNIGMGETIEVCPTETTNYTADVVYDICNGTQVIETDDITVNTSDLVELAATPSSPNICQGESVFITITGADSYSWSTNNGIEPINGSELWITADTTTIYSIIGSTEECVDTIDIELNVGSFYDFQTIVDLCAGETYVLPNGEIVNSAGIYPVYLQTTNNQCDSTITTEINLIDQNIVELTENICEGDAITLADGSIATQTGSYTVVLTSLVNGCDSTIVTDVIVTPSYDLIETINVCDDGSYTLPDGSYPPSSGTYNFPFQTLIGCDSNIVVALQLFPEYSFQYGVEICDGESFTLPDGTSVDIEGFYPTMLQTIEGCDSLITIDLVVNDLTDLNIGVEASYCPYDGDIALIPSPEGGSLTGDLLNGFVLEHDNASPGVYSVSYSFTDSNGCTSTESPEYVLAEPISPSFDFHVSCNDLYLFNSTPDPFEEYDYEWYLNHEFTGVSPELVLEFYENGNYELGLEVTDIYGCSYSIIDTINLHHELDIDGFFMPNIFTPNDDGDNEKFRIPEPYNTCILYSINIFNKWGNLVYQMHNNSSDFGGYSQNGTLLPEGVYYYTLEVQGYPCSETPELRDWCSGSITLIRN